MNKVFNQLIRKRYPLYLLILFFIGAANVPFIFLTSQEHEVTIQLDDKVKTVLTQAKTVSEVLKEEGIELKQGDFVWPDAGTKIEGNESILVRRAWPVTVVVGSKREIHVNTTSRTVGGLLSDLGIQLDHEDIVKPDLNQPIKQNQTIEVIDVEYGLVEQTQEMKYKTVRKADNTMAKGNEKVVQPGKTGKEKITYMATYYNGEIVNVEPLHKEVVHQPKEQVVAFGTLESVTVGGYTFLPKKILKNVKLTAYGPGEEHTGKAPNHPQYAITRSGVRAKEGRTISVDPDIIPLGWWVYIDGYGLFRAEDTGSAVKGKKIDIYFEDDQKASNFGLKRGVSVYVIGPDKPSSN
jgi:3D (Asp-Asp-Asp) domain-containing protein